MICRSLVAVATIGALNVVPPLAAAPAGAEPSTTAQSAGPATSQSGTRAPTGEAGLYRITLLTGDVVALQVNPDGRQAAWVADPVDERRPAHVYELDGQVHVVPAEAGPYVASGALDSNLFNVSLLAQQGFDDASTDELPLLVEAPARGPANAMPPAPDGTEEVLELDSVNTVSVVADKTDIRTTWKDIRGSQPAAGTSTDARLENGAYVWLNGKVETTLDDSVSQIGTPQAWAAGFDGAGTTVAVLDTGYDPTHPDLDGRVVEAKNFTENADPEGSVAVDGHGHGTHVAATVGGSGDASDGDRKGVAPGTDLIIGKVLNNAGEGFEDQIIAGMEWAVDNGADVVSMSLGTPWVSDGTDPMSQAVNRLTRESDALFVVAAGNAGPGEQTIGSPGAAHLALTVGAVDKNDQPAWFSSRGPRWGDGAIKPEITAPGVDIVAARAAGTSLGNLLDEHYTSLNGTSMATPHVAGAAAILADQHPRWTAGQLKARLISTSKTLANEPVTFQGGGRVDVAAAVQSRHSVGRATMHLGRVPDNAAPVTRTLTYSNSGNQPLRLHLTDEVRRTGVRDQLRPELRLSRPTITVPAHGSARVTATLVPRQTTPGGYAGDIVARAIAGGRAVHTTLAFTVAGANNAVTIRAIDRSGRPATGPVDLWNLDTGEWIRNFLTDGKTTFNIQDGTYSLVGSIEAAGDWFLSTEHTIFGEPELRVTGNRTLRYDARDARPLDVTTPRRADLDQFHIFWARTAGDRSISMIVAQGGYGEEVYALKGSGARTGAFTLGTEWQLVQPLLTARVTGPGGFQLPSPQIASTQLPLVGEHTLPLVDAGDGTAEDFAGIDADGAAALVRRTGNPDDLPQQANAAADAGADLLLAYNTTDEEWIDEVWESPLPVYRIDRATGQTLLDRLARGAATLDLDGFRDSTYQYELAYSAKGRIPGGRVYHAHPQSLAIMHSDYRHNSDRMLGLESWIPYVDRFGVANSMSQLRRGPLVRTEYVNTDGVEWQRFGQPHPFLRYYWTTTAPTAYEAGQHYRQTWWGPLVHPAVPPTANGGASAPVLGNGYIPVTRYRDAIRMNLPHYYYGGTLTGTIDEHFGDWSEVTLERDGEIVGTSTWPIAQWTVPADKAEYALTLDAFNSVENWADTSSHTSTTWHFESARTKESGTVLPLLQAAYTLDTNAYNAVPSGTSYPMTILPGYQPGGSGPGRFDATVDVSFDDGATWQSVPVTRAGPRLRAELPAASGPGFASVRVDITDADGNRLTQRIDRAWRIAAP
jgi:subtilisin family serine protease